MNTPQPIDNSHLVVTDDNKIRAYVGKDAVNLMRAKVLMSGIRMWRTCKIIPTRGVTIAKMLILAKEYTGKTYKRTECEKAEADIKVWIEQMTLGLPAVEEKRTPTKEGN